MSAIEEPRTAATVGKDTGDSPQLSASAGESTLPQLPYAEAVHRALCAVEVLPDTVETGVRVETLDGQRELFIRLEWLPGHDDLLPEELQAAGVIAQWSHLAGWSVSSGTDIAEPDIDALADPDTVAERCMHALLCGLRCDCEKPPPGRWEHAAALHLALAAYDERGETNR
ncbi:hypothetical protein [Streptomyces sp. NPDC096013]|uniref:hypothetical protein n=1 Tax=Streptomyces sp. NPDC096013 TaxID=3366069 RepID=UPI0037F8C816